MVVFSKKSSHLKALLLKNALIWRRNRRGSMMQILAPVIFACILIVFRNSDKATNVPQLTYYNTTNFEFNDVLDASDALLIKDCSGESGGKVALAPAGDAIVDKLVTVFESYGLKTQTFATNGEIDSYTSQWGYDQGDLQLCFGIVISKNNVNDQYEYLMRWNTTRYDNPDIPPTSNKRVDTLIRANESTINSYASSGFLLIQNLIDNIILQTETNNANAKIHARIASRTVEAHVSDSIADDMSDYLRMFLSLPMIYMFKRFINSIVTEKEKRIREGMKIMGLKNSAFYLSWFIFYFIINTVISLLIASILKSSLFKFSSWGLIFLWHWEFTLSFMCLGFLISVFFNKAQAANVCSVVIGLVFVFLQSVISDDSSPAQHLLAGIAPQISIGLSGSFILQLEAAQLGLTSDTVNLKINNYKIIYHYGIMVFDMVIFVLLGIYLDQVLPSEYGVRKHPLFCLMRKRRGLKRQDSQVFNSPEEEMKKIKEEAGNYEEPDPIMKAQDAKNESIIVKNLSKKYSNGKLAVDDISLNMYSGQIFALLGHNGAGKTTTISMITGMIESTSGATKIFGMDVNNQLEDIRKVMGVCPQHDILFDDLTVEEHLKMFAVFKGVDSSGIKSEVEQVIHDIGLADKRKYLSKNLSGGQKRKLSVGIAFIGGSKFILLDEPSSGMDTSARRKLWDMLKNYKHNRIILLTTHFMDEADYLGDRIGIMAEGKVKCLGSSLFLKTKFGVGYNLTMVKKDVKDPSQPIKDLVSDLVPESKLLSDVSAEVAFQLPLQATSKFKILFDSLDENLEKLRVNNYGVSVTTLEEVFLNVAKLNAPEKHFVKELPDDKEQDSDLDSFNLQNQRIKSRFEIFKTHFLALSLKRIRYFKRDKKGLVCELILPVLIAIFGILVSKAISIGDTTPLPLADNMYNFHFQVDYNSIVPDSNAAMDQTFLNNLANPSYTLTPKTVSSVDEFNLDVFNDQGKDIMHDPINVFSFYMQTFDNTNKDYYYLALVDTKAQEASPFAANKINNAILRTATSNNKKTINVIVTPFLKTLGSKKIDNIYNGIVYAFVFSIGMSFIPAGIITFIVKERQVNAKHQQLVSGVSITAYWLSNYTVDILKYLVPGILNALMAMAFKAHSITDGDKLGALWTIFIFYGFSVVPSVYLMSFLFKDYGNAQIICFFFHFLIGYIGGLTIGILRIFDSTRHVAKILQWILRPHPTFAMTSGLLDLANREVYALTDDIAIPSAFNITLVGGDLMLLIITGVLYFTLLFVVEYFKNAPSLFDRVSGAMNVPYIPKPMDDDVEREMREIETSDEKTYSIKIDKLRKVYPLGYNNHKVAVDQISFGVKNGECFALLGTNGAGKTTTFKILTGDYTQTSGNINISGYRIPAQLEHARHDIGYCPQFDALLDNLTAKEHLEMYAAIKGIPKDLRSRFVEKQLREMNLKQYEHILAGTYSGGNKRKLSVAIAMIGNPNVVFLDEPSTGMDPEARRFMWNVISRISTERKLSSIVLTTHSMEEAEALATKMSIMVNGNLKCMGTTQHIKTKYGGGYEIEIKIRMPDKDLVKKKIEIINYKSGDILNEEQVTDVLTKLKALNLQEQLDENASGSAIYAQMKTGKTLVDSLIEWILVEKNGELVQETLTKNFGSISVIEHFQSFYRFKASNKLTIGNFFGCLEENKTNLNIQQYSICQSTIEQIFNAFALEDELSRDKNYTAIEVNDNQIVKQ